MGEGQMGGKHTAGRLAMGEPEHLLRGEDCLPLRRRRGRNGLTPVTRTDRPLHIRTGAKSPSLSEDVASTLLGLDLPWTVGRLLGFPPLGHGLLSGTEPWCVPKATGCVPVCKGEKTSTITCQLAYLHKSQNVV